MPARPPPQGLAWLWILALFTLGSYVWFLSPAFLAEPQGRTDYYDLLAQGFLAGTPFLAAEPDPRLAMMANPYSPGERDGIPYLHDASYFQGKYSLYFGPVPAAVAALLRLATGRGAQDDWLTFLGIVLTYWASCLILISLKRDLFPQVPAWLLAAAAMVAGFANPILWTLNYPAYNSAAVAWGVAFLMAGINVSLPGLQGRETRMWRPVMASILWSCSLAARLSLTPAVLALSGILAIRVARPPGHRLARATVVLLPLLVVASLLGIYNFVRFGSAFETGLRYQLAGTDFTTFDKAFSHEYVPFNLFNYLAMPPGISSTFPFLDADPGRRSLPGLGRAPSMMHEPEQVAGVLLTTPYAAMAGFAFARLLVRRHSPTASERSSEGTPRGDDQPLVRLLAPLLLGFLLVLVPLWTYFYTSMRYLLDFAPLLSVLAAMGTWIGYSACKGHNRTRRALGIAVIASALLSVSAGWLLALSDSPALALWRTILGLAG